MKTLKIIALCLAFAACESQDNAAPEKALPGKWEWVETRGGIAGITIKATKDQQRQLIYSSEGDFEAFKNGVSIMKTKYTTRKGKSITSTELIPMIYYLPDSLYGHQSYHIKSDSLFLFDEFFDGFGHTYVRIR